MNNTLPTMIPFDPSKYDGYLFDCDGGLADTMPLHYRCKRSAARRKLCS